MAKDITWGIVATVAEPAPLVMAFVAHHLFLGASEIHLYFDQPRDPTADLLEGVPGLRVTRCDGTHWGAIAQWRPKQHNNRQTANATHARTICAVDYLLHCDADEFLRPGSNVAAQWAEVPDVLTWMKVFNLERAFVRGAARHSIFDGVFKVHYQGRSDTALRTSDLMPIGFTGHAAGKAFVRARVGLNIGIHVPRYGHIKDRIVPPHHPADQLELVHFDGLTPLHWAAKFIRQAALTPERLAKLPPFRVAQWQRILTCLDDPGALNALYEDMNGYTPAEVAALEDEGDMTHEAFDLTPALEAVFPGQDIDLSPAHFDALLQPRIDRWRRMARKNGVL